MRKKLLFTFLLLLTCFSIAKAETIQVGSGTNSKPGMPIYSNWKYGLTQQIYTSEEIGKTGTITSIGFYATQDMGQAQIFDIYLVKTSKSSFDNAEDYISASESDKVFSGTVTFAVGNWTTINFDTPFEYNGSANLCLIVNSKTGPYTDNSAKSWLVYSSTNQSIWRLNDGYGPYDPASPKSVASGPTPKFVDYKSQLQLTFSDSGGGSGTPIHSVYVYGYEPPVAGENSLDYLNLTIPSDANYHVSWSGWWNDDSSDEYVYDAFVAGTRYSLNVELKANDGYYFADDCTFYLNGGTELVDYEYSKVSSDDNTRADLWSVITAATAGGGGGTVSAPASADFETGDFSQIAFENDATYPWIVTSDDAASGTYCMKSGNSGQNSTSSAISVTVNYASDGHITFDAKCMGEGANTVWDKCIFYIDDVAQFTYGAKGDTWDNYGYNVTAGNHTFKWEYTKDSSISATGDAFFVDNIEFGLGTLILPPTNLAVTDIQWNSATVTWESSASTFILQYKAADSSEWTTVSSITDKSYILTDLQEQTTYDVRVQVEGSDLWASTTFTTVERFPSPTDLQVLAVTPYTAVLDWTDNCGASAWQVAVNTWDNITDVTRKPFILTGLTPGTENAFAVRAVMEVDGETFYSPWSSTYYFTTTVPNPLPEISSVTPTPNSATITWEGESDSYKVKYRKYDPSNRTILFIEDFDSSESLPEGWLSVDADGDGYKWYTNEEAQTALSATMSFTAHSGTGIVTSASYINNLGALTPDNWLITPKVTLGSRASAWLCGQDPSYPSEHFAFYVSTTDTDPSSFTKVSNEYVTTNEYREYTADLSAYAGQEGYVAVRHYNVSDMYWLNLDDFSLYEDGEWTVIETTDKTVTFEGLDPNIEYEFEVIGIMRGQEDASSSIHNFMTLDSNPVPFDVVAKPASTSARISWTGYSDNYTVYYREKTATAEDFFEDFEGLTDGALPEGWIAIDSDGDGYNWLTHTNTGTGNHTTHSGDGVAISASYDNDTSSPLHPDNWLITPKVTLGTLVSAWLCGQDASYAAEHFAFYVSTTGTDLSDFTKISDEYVATGTYTEYTADLSAYVGQRGYVAIRHYNVSDMFILNLDDFGIYGVPSGGEVAEWQTVNTTATDATITGLNPDTEYEFKVVGNKSGETATTVIYYFTTTQTPTSLAFNNNGDNESVISANNGVLADVTIQNLTLESGKWQGICLPFDVDVENSPLAGADVRTFESKTSIDGKLFLNFLTPVTEMKAGTPYIVKMESDLSNPVFENVTIRSNQYYVELENSVFFNALYYYFTSDEDQTQFFKMIGSTGTDLQLILKGDNLQAFESYIKVNYPANYDEIFLNTGEYNDMITGLKAIGNAEEEVIYNLAGQRLGKKQRGFNIVNGKNVMIK